MPSIRGLATRFRLRFAPGPCVVIALVIIGTADSTFLRERQLQKPLLLAAEAEATENWQDVGKYLRLCLERQPCDALHCYRVGESILRGECGTNRLRAVPFYAKALRLEGFHLPASLRPAELLLESHPQQSLLLTQRVLDSEPENREATRLNLRTRARLQSRHAPAREEAELWAERCSLVALVPGDPVGARTTARLGRLHAAAVSSAEGVSVADVLLLADDFIDTMVDHAEDEAAARLTRLAYCQTYELSHAVAEDVKRLVEIRSASSLLRQLAAGIQVQKKSSENHVPRLARASTIQRQVGDAIEAFKTALRCGERGASTFLRLTSLLHRVRQNREALEYCLLASEPAPSFRSLSMTCQIPLAGNADRRLIDHFEKLLATAVSSKILAGEAGFLFDLSVVWEQQGRSDDAILVARRVLELSLESVGARNNLAWFLSADKQEHTAARTLIEAGIDLAGDLPILLDAKGVILCGLQQDPQAVDCLQKSLQEPAEKSVRWLHLAEARHALGQVPDAVSCFNHVEDPNLFALSPRDRQLLLKLRAELPLAIVQDATP